MSLPLPQSVRDPAGALYFTEDSIYRVVKGTWWEQNQALLHSRILSHFRERKQLVATRFLTKPESKPVLERLHVNPEAHQVLEHERVWFQSFPSEWCPEMLLSAGELHLSLAESLLEMQAGLKDATAYNVLFEGTQPVFVDWLSFEQRNPHLLTWAPYDQFVRMFLLPLLLDKMGILPAHKCFAGFPDGIRPEDAYDLIPGFWKVRPSVFFNVSLPKWMEKNRRGERHDRLYHERTSSNTEKAKFILQSLFRSLRCSLRKQKPPEKRDSVWSDYMTQDFPYNAQQLEEKEHFVRDALLQIQAKSVLDMGCNTGHFSALAARTGARVVSIDNDPQAISHVWRRAQSDGLDIQPLIVDIVRPTPASGWMNRETSSFLSRAHKKFDAILVLAASHHLAAGEGIPYTEISRMLSSLQSRHLLIEYVGESDQSVRHLLRGRIFSGLDESSFRRAFEAHFEPVSEVRFTGMERTLFLYRNRAC